MASARARLGRARRGIIKRKKQTGVVTGALSTLGTVAAFGAGQAKKADTAWGEYEAGYKELGGDVADIKKPGFFKRTAQQILPGGKTGLPEGEVRMGATMYDRGQIQKAGSFLGSDAAAMLSDEQRQQYLGRTAPGRAQTTEEISATRKSLRPETPFTGGEYDVDEEFDYDAYTAESPVYQPGQEPGLATVGQDWETPIPLGKSAPFQTTEAGGSGADPNPRGPNLGSMWSKFKGVVKQQFTEGPEYGQALPLDQQVVRKEKDISAEPNGGKPQWDWQLPWTSKKDKKDKAWAQARRAEKGMAYARGGDFITNGPQKILVGDNPGGRERVTIKPLPSKNGEAKFGRFGDKLMREKDGELVHISPIEKDWSDEDLEKYGAGTTNPITGKKEYFLGALATGLGVAGSIYGGFSAQGNRADVAAGRVAAGDIYQEQLGLLGDVRTQAVTGATQQAELGFDVTQSQLAAGGRESTMGARTAMRGVQEAGTSAISQAGLATSGTIQQKSATQAGDISAKLKSDMTKLFETRQLAGRERDLTISTAKEKSDLAYRSGQMSAEEAYESTLTGLESTPTTFMEGLFG